MNYACYLVSSGVGATNEGVKPAGRDRKDTEQEMTHIFLLPFGRRVTFTKLQGKYYQHSVLEE